MRKRGLFLALVGVTVLAGSALATSPVRVTYHGKSFGSITFWHPAQWKARYAGIIAPTYGPSHSYLIVALSTEHLQRPTCSYVPQPDGSIRVECDPLLDTLPLGGVYVEWWDNFDTPYPDPNLTYAPGAKTRVGGALAKILIDPTSKTAGGICPKGTTGSVQVFVAGTRRTLSAPGRGGVYMYACTNTTNFPRFMAQLVPMLRSVRIHA